MKVIHLDLDNTLIYSCRHDIGEQRINVELYQGREISYMTAVSHRLLRQIKQECLIVPTTTRTKEQYDRIDLRAGAFEYALICNGGLLLVNGKSDPAWYAASRELTADCAGNYSGQYSCLRWSRFGNLRFGLLRNCLFLQNAASRRGWS